MSRPAPQVGFPSVPTASGSSRNSEILLPFNRAHGPTTPTAILTQGSQVMNVSNLRDSKFKPREMKGGTDRVRTKWEPKVELAWNSGFSTSLGDPFFSKRGQDDNTYRLCLILTEHCHHAGYAVSAI